MQKIQKGDDVVVITGRDKGKRGTVLRSLDAEHVVVEGVNRVKKHQRPNPMKGVHGRHHRQGNAARISRMWRCSIRPRRRPIASAFEALEDGRRCASSSPTAKWWTYERDKARRRARTQEGKGAKDGKGQRDAAAAQAAADRASRKDGGQEARPRPAKHRRRPAMPAASGAPAGVLPRKGRARPDAAVRLQEPRCRCRASRRSRSTWASARPSPTRRSSTTRSPT